MERHAPRGGGKRHGVRVACLFDGLAAKQLGSEAAKFVKDVRTIRCKGDKSETEKVVLVANCKEQKSIVGWAYFPNKTVNLLLADAMHGFSLRGRELERGVEGKYRRKNTPLSRIRNTRYTLVNDCDLSLGEVVSSIQSYPSPEFLNSLSFIKKFYPLPVGARAKFTKVAHENSSNLRHSEALQSRKNPAYYCNTSKLKGIHMNNLTKTVYSPLTTHNSLKKSAFTLAEVLITLGIIGVVAALTLPSVVANYKEKQLTTAWKKAYSDVANAALLMSQNNEDLSTEQKVGKAFAKYLKVDKVCNANKGVEQGCWRENTKIYSKDGSYAYSDPTDIGGGGVCMILTSGTVFCIDYGGKVSPLYFDINGYLKPNTRGKDVFYALFNRENYMVKPAKGYKQYWGPADCGWITCTFGDGTCEGDNLGYGCSAEKLLK